MRKRPRNQRSAGTSAHLPGRSADAAAGRLRDSGRARWTKPISHLALPGVFFLLVWMAHPFREVFEFNPDEGTECIKVLMMARGHALYSDIYNDQPPLITYMLRAWFALTDWTLHDARLFVLLCASVLLWALARTVRHSWGLAAALVAVVLLLPTQLYVNLSVSAMMAIPNLMFAMLSVWAAAVHRQTGRLPWAAVSGIMLALSMLTKLITGLLGPLILLAVISSGLQRKGQRRVPVPWWPPVVVWVLAFGATGAITLLAAVPLAEWKHLVLPHIGARTSMAHAGWDQEYVKMITGDIVYVPLMVVGLIRVVRRRDWFSLMPFAWYVLLLWVFRTHRPLWNHYAILLSVPMCWAAGIGLGPVLSRAGWRGSAPTRGARDRLLIALNVSAVVCACLAAASIPGKVGRERRFAQQHLPFADDYRYVSAVMAELGRDTRYVATDQQLLPFSSGLLSVPPELCVTGTKRFRSGDLDAERLVDLLKRYQPEQVFLSWRCFFPRSPALYGYLNTHYVEVYRDWKDGVNKGDRLYVVKTLTEAASRALRFALDRVPGSWRAHLNLAVQLARAGKCDAAVEVLRNAKRRFPSRFAPARLERSFRRLNLDETAAAQVLARLEEQAGGG